MTDSKTYSAPKYFWLLPAVLVALTIYVYWQPNEWGYRLFVTALCLFGCGSALFVPLKVTLTADNQLIAEAVLRRTRLNIEDIITLVRENKSVTLQHRDGKLELSYVINDLPGLCAELKSRNPALVEEPGPLRRLSRSPWFIISLIVGITVLTLGTIFLAVNYPDLF